MKNVSGKYICKINTQNIFANVFKENECKNHFRDHFSVKAHPGRVSSQSRKMIMIKSFIACSIALWRRDILLQLCSVFMLYLLKRINDQYIWMRSLHTSFNKYIKRDEYERSIKANCHSMWYRRRDDITGGFDVIYENRD